MLRVVFLALLTGLAAGSGLAGTPVTYADDGRALFRFDAPDFWTIRTGGARDLTLPGTDDVRPIQRVIGLEPVTVPGVFMGFVSPEGVATLDQGTAYLTDIGPFLVEDATVVSDRNIAVAGLPARVFSGTGTRQGQGVNFTATVIDMPNGRVAVAVVILEAGVDPGIVDDINAIFASFRSIR